MRSRVLTCQDASRSGSSAAGSPSREISDPLLSTLTITEVDVSDDLCNARTKVRLLTGERDESCRAEALRHLSRAIRDALRGLKIEVARATVANILAEAGLEPAPDRNKKRTWKQFVRSHWNILYVRILTIQPNALANERLRQERLDLAQGVAPSAGTSTSSMSERLAPRASAEEEITTAPVRTIRTTSPISDAGAAADLHAEVAAEPDAAADPAALLSSAPMTSGSHPRAVDNSALPAFPEIRNQGGLGTCSAFALAYYQYTHELGLLAGWNNKTSDNSTKVSPRWVWNLANQGQNQAINIYDGLEVLRDHGAVTWSDFPYIDDATNPLTYRAWPVQAAIWKKAMQYRVRDSGSLSQPTDPDSLAAEKAWLANGHVLTFETIIESWEFDDEGIHDDPSTGADNAYRGQAIATWANGSGAKHAMTLVGYNDDIWVDLNDDHVVDAPEKGAFKIANSWGPDWQNQGYAWLHYDAIYRSTQVPGGPSGWSRHGALVTPLLWVRPRANYQPDLVAEFTAETLRRGDMRLLAGRAEYGAVEPFDEQDYYAFSRAGGLFAWDGSEVTTPQAATFAVDLTDLASSYHDLHYLLRGIAAPSSRTTLSKLTLVDRLRWNRRTVTSDPAVTLANDAFRGQGVRYEFVDPSKVARLESSVSGYEFGPVSLGKSASRYAQLTNTGTGDLLITSLTTSNVLFWNEAETPLVIHPGETTGIDVLFAPAATRNESGNLVIRSNDYQYPHASYPLTGSGTSTFGGAPVKVYVLPESAPLDNIIGMRLSVVNTSSTPFAIGDHRLTYFYYDPDRNQDEMVWDTYYTTVSGGVEWSLRKLFAPLSLGIRKADTALEISFPAGTVLNPGGTLIVEGKLHHKTWNLDFDENDDWSWYQRPDMLAENVVVQNRATEVIVFGSSPEVDLSGVHALTVSPNPASSEITVTFQVDDPGSIGNMVWLDLYLNGVWQTLWMHQVTVTGLQTTTLDLAAAGLPSGDYILALSFGFTLVDHVEFQKS